MSTSILIVDDEIAIVAALAALLADEGYAVSVAFDGAEAWRAIQRAPPDLLITDVLIPSLDGIDLVMRLRARGRGFPVIMMSANRLARDLPGVRFFQKPFDLDDLLDEVARCAPLRPRT